MAEDVLAASGPSLSGAGSQLVLLHSTYQWCCTHLRRSRPTDRLVCLVLTGIRLCSALGVAWSMLPVLSGTPQTKEGEAWLLFARRCSTV